MGGWVTLIGDIDDFDIRLERFKNIFSCEGMPVLKIDLVENYRDIKIFLWGWTERNIPDVHVKKCKNVILLLSGVLTNNGLVEMDENLKNSMGKEHEWPASQIEKWISQLNGSFSLLMYDQQAKKTQLFTDRFASRSVWYTQENGVWITGNYPTAIASMMRDFPKLDSAGLWSFFHAGRQVGHHSMFSNIHFLTRPATDLLD